MTDALKIVQDDLEDCGHTIPFKNEGRPRSSPSSGNSSDVIPLLKIRTHKRKFEDIEDALHGLVVLSLVSPYVPGPFWDI